MNDRIKMPRLTLNRARELVKRELGISASDLSAPPEMNENRHLPCYTMHTGKLYITVATVGNGDGRKYDEMIVLTVLYENSTRCFHEYFYADTLDFAAQYTEARFWDDLYEISEDKNQKEFQRRLFKESHTACQKHFYDDAE